VTDPDGYVVELGGGQPSIELVEESEWKPYQRLDAGQLFPEGVQQGERFLGELD
jgi:hypothetical protein